MRLIDRTIAYPEGPEGAAYELAGYLTADTLDMIRVRTLEVRSDIYDHCTISFSADNGRTWSESQPYPVRRETPEGVYRQSFGNTFVDPVNGRLLVTASQTLLPTDQMLEALTHSTLTYRVSEDGGRSWLFDEQVVQHGDAYSAEYPIDGVWTGKNVAHVANEMVFSSDGRLVLPLQRTCLQEDGTLFCPPGALSYHDLIMLIGAWQDDGRIRWTAGQPVTLPPEISTRGVTEGAVAEMPDGRFLMVMRTSNAGNLKLPGHKWYCVSHDGGDLGHAAAVGLHRRQPVLLTRQLLDHRPALLGRLLLVRQHQPAQPGGQPAPPPARRRLDRPGQSAAQTRYGDGRGHAPGRRSAAVAGQLPGIRGARHRPSDRALDPAVGRAAGGAARVPRTRLPLPDRTVTRSDAMEAHHE